jgi:hypothetical protein
MNRNTLTKSILALAAFAALPLTAQAGDRFRDHGRLRDRDYRDRDHRHHDVRRDDHCETRKVWVEPVYDERVSQVWVEPVYRTETVPVRIPGYWETKCERVWCEPVFEIREVVRYERGRRVVCRERVCVREGGWHNVDRKVWVPEQCRYETRRVLVCEGRYETKRERVCVRDGYWKTVEVPRERVTFGINVRF